MQSHLTRSDIVQAALALEGKPFIRAGAQECGMNCIGFLAVVLRNVNGDPELIRSAEAGAKFAREKSLGAVRKAFSDSLIPIPLRDAGPGDVLLFRSQGREQHVGIITNPGYVIHASEFDRRVVHHRIHPYLNPIAAFEIPGVA